MTEADAPLDWLTDPMEFILTQYFDPLTRAIKLKTKIFKLKVSPTALLA